MNIPEQDPRGLIAGGVVIVALAGVTTAVYLVVAEWILLPLIAVALVFGAWFIVAGVRRRRARGHAGDTPAAPTATAGDAAGSAVPGREGAPAPSGWHFVASADRGVIAACYEQFSVLSGPPVGYAALLDADAAELAERAGDKTAPGRGYAGFRRFGQGELTRVTIADLLRGLAGEAVHGDVHIAMAAGDSPIMASSVYGEIYREAVAQGIEPFPMYSVQDHAVAAFVMASCRLIGGTTVPPEGRPEQPELALTAAQAGEAVPEPPRPVLPLPHVDEPTGLRAGRGLTVVGGAEAARALAEASYDPADADGVVIGHQPDAASPPSITAQGRLTCPGCGREIPFHAIVTPGCMGDGDTAICDVCHSRVALSYYPVGGHEEGSVLLVAHTLVSPSQRQSVRIVSLEASLA